jgi:two-component system response regulator HydG
MKPEPPTILLAEGEVTLREKLADALRFEGFNVIACGDGADALKHIRVDHVDALMTELRIPGLTGSDLIDHARQQRPNVVIMVITAFGDVATAVQVMKKGVHEFIGKPACLEDVVYKLKRLLALGALGREFERLGACRSTHETAEEALVGSSNAIRAVRAAVAEAAQDSRNLLITGERGVGTESVARAIHDSGIMRGKPFVSVPCAESSHVHDTLQLFKRGDAAMDDLPPHRSADAPAAPMGTIFLAEVADLEPDAQAALFTSLFRRGGTRTNPAAIRVISATSIDLPSAVRRGSFREDLRLCLSAARIDVPPLRARPGDVPMLFARFVERFNREWHVHCPGAEPSAVERLRGYSWPGNVYELRNIVERAVLAADGDLITSDDLILPADASSQSAISPGKLCYAVQALEKRQILRALESANGNKLIAARTLGIGRSSLYRKLQELGISDHSSCERMETPT